MPPVSSAKCSRILSPRSFSPADIGGDRVDDDFGTLRHLHRFLARDAALVVLAIAQQDDGAPRGPVALVLHQLVAARKVDGVIHGGAAARPQHAHPVRECLGVVGEVLRDFGRRVETDDERLVALRPDDLVQELDGRFLFELEAVTHRVAGINQQADAQRQVGLPAEGADALCRLVVVEHPKVALGKVFDEVTALVGDGEDHIDFVHALADDGQLVVSVAAVSLLGRLRRSRSRGCAGLRSFVLSCDGGRIGVLLRRARRRRAWAHVGLR